MKLLKRVVLVQKMKCDLMIDLKSKQEQRMLRVMLLTPRVRKPLAPEDRYTTQALIAALPSASYQDFPRLRAYSAGLKILTTHEFDQYSHIVSDPPIFTTRRSAKIVECPQT